MPKNLFSIEVKTEELSVKSFVRLTGIAISGDNFKARYENTAQFPTGTELGISTQSVDRSIDNASGKGDFVSFNGTSIGLVDLILITAQFAEKWRAEDDKARADDAAAAAAEKARWDALTPEQQKAEIDARRAALQLP